MVLQLFIDSVDLSAITAKSNSERPEKKVFLCGGIGEGSIRSHLDKYLREHKLPVFRAEDVIDWRNSSVFQGDLLELEKYIAALSGVIVLISESAGSIAELGSFVNDKEIRKKLLVIIESQYRKKPSFISDGLLANLSQETCEDEHAEQNTQHLYVIEDVPEDPITRKKDFSGYDQNFGIGVAVVLPAGFSVQARKISILVKRHQFPSCKFCLAMFPSAPSVKGRFSRIIRSRRVSAFLAVLFFGGLLGILLVPLVMPLLVEGSPATEVLVSIGRGL